MSKLILIRHGQASFGQANYDNLSELGVAQSRTLGEYWASMGRKFDAVFSGAQERQKQTLLAVQEAYIQKGLDFPEAGEVMPEFNEYDSTGIMTRLFPTLLNRDQRLKEVFNNSAGVGSNTQKGRKSFQEIFEIVVNYWVKGEITDDTVESWQAFKGRVEGGLAKIMSAFPSGKTVAVFTSGGPICTSMRYALCAPDEVGINLSWVIKNASITEFIYNSGRITLTGFNMTPQFRDDAMITYR